MLRIPIVDENGDSAWPAVFPPSRIDELRTTVGARHFSSQMMLTFVPVDRARLDPDALHLYIDEFDVHTARIGTHLITGASVYWDPSSGRNNRDGSVCVLLYRDDKSHNMFIHDVMYLTVGDEELHPMTRQCESVLSFMLRHHTRTVSIETNGIGNTLPEFMCDVAAHRGERIFIRKITNNKNKESRILDAIEPVLTTGRLYAHRRVQSTPLLAEMLGWSPLARGTHDDGLDAVAGAIYATPVPVRPFGQNIRPITANTKFEI